MIAVFTFVLFLMAGAVKAAQTLAWIPVDLTMFAALGTIAAISLCLVRRSFAIPQAVVPVLLLFLLFVPSLLWMEPNAYAVEKESRFFSLTLLAALAPIFLVRDLRSLRWFLGALTAVGILLAGDAAVTLVRSGGDLLRLSALGSTTIALGRCTGAALLWVAILGIEGRLKFLHTLALVGLLSVILLASGSRGPLLAALAVLAVVALLFHRGSAPRLYRLGGLALVGALGVLFSLSYLPVLSLSRVTSLLSGEMGASASWRIDALHVSLGAIARTPLGTGLAGFATVSDLPLPSLREYPHNLLAESFLEGGWLAGFCLAGLTAVAVRRAWRLAGEAAAEYRGAFALLLFCLMNALVSGDMNDNRLFFAFLALGLSLRHVPLRIPSGKEHLLDVQKQDRPPDICSPAV